MINYAQNIQNHNLSIYDSIAPDNTFLFIPTNTLEKLISKYLIGHSLSGLPLRSRSKVVKSLICKALGYPIPKQFRRTQPRFPGQNFDVYIQKSLNVQIWNEKIDPNRRYVFVKVNKSDIISNVRVIIGDTLIQYDRTGKLTKKYQSTMQLFNDSKLLSNDSVKFTNWVSFLHQSLHNISPNSYPNKYQTLPIKNLYDKLLPMVGCSFNYLDALQERNRGAKLHALVCEYLGYSTYEDDGTYPDIINQLLEIKLQTSPTIDLGMHSPDDGLPIVRIPNITFHSGDIRYAIFDSSVEGLYIKLNKLYLVSGYYFTKYFPLVKGKGQNAKIQLPLPDDFFD